MKILRLPVFVILLCACTSSDGNGLPDVYFDEQVSCANYWGAHLEEWKQNGGGVQASLRDTKRQILQDDESYFAKLIRKAWQYQAHSRDTRKLELGQWPIPDNAYREATFALLQAQSDLDGQCKSGASLVPLLWRELARNGEVLKLEEMPRTCQ